MFAKPFQSGIFVLFSVPVARIKILSALAPPRTSQKVELDYLKSHVSQHGFFVFIFSVGKIAIFFRQTNTEFSPYDFSLNENRCLVFEPV